MVVPVAAWSGNLAGRVSNVWYSGEVIDFSSPTYRALSADFTGNKLKDPGTDGKAYSPTSAQPFVSLAYPSGAVLTNDGTAGDATQTGTVTIDGW